jgi:hypothetical protein
MVTRAVPLILCVFWWSAEGAVNLVRTRVSGAPCPRKLVWPISKGLGYGRTAQAFCLPATASCRHSRISSALLALCTRSRAAH